MGRAEVPPAGAAEAMSERYEVVRRQLSRIRRLAAASTLDAPLRRVAALRAAVDRLDGLREEVHGLVAQARANAARSADAADIERAGKVQGQQRTLHAQGMGWEERASVYLLANRSLELLRRADERALQEVRDLEFYVRDLTRSLDGARLEALQLLRAEVTISAEDYLHFVSEID